MQQSVSPTASIAAAAAAAAASLVELPLPLRDELRRALQPADDSCEADDSHAMSVASRIKVTWTHIACKQQCSCAERDSLHKPSSK